MNKLLITITILIVASCSTTAEKDKTMEKETKHSNEESLNDDSIPKVTGDWVRLVILLSRLYDVPPQWLCLLKVL